MMNLNRRNLILSAVAAGGVGLTSKSLAQRALTGETAEEVYARALVIDTMTVEHPTFDPTPLLKAGMTGASIELYKFPRNYENAMAELDGWHAAFNAPDTKFHSVRKAADFAEAKRLGKFAVVLDSQDGAILGWLGYANGDQNIEALRAFHQKGLRVLQLAYTNSNALGAGYSDVYNTGLNRLGRAVVAEMNSLGMLVDTAHCAEATTLDAIERSTRPIAVTHSGCYSLFPDKRNKSDTVIRALARRGGYMGIYNFTMWMTTNPTSSVETIVDHIDHAVNVGGIDLVGFGSDWNVVSDIKPQAEKVSSMQSFVDRNKDWPGGAPMHGHVTASDLDGPDRMHVLALALGRRGYKGAAIEKILGGNFVRVFGAACG